MLGVFQGLSGRSRDVKHLLLLSGVETGLVGCAARSLLTIMSELFRLLP